jgi:hypothetical protein
MKRWPPENNALLREDAAAGLTSRQCALKRRLNPATVALHARRNGIEFAPQTTTADCRPKSMASMAAKADEQLRAEIAAARRESKWLL